MLKALLFFVALVAVAGIGGCAYLQHPKFGPSMDSIRNAAVLASPNYVDGLYRFSTVLVLRINSNNGAVAMATHIISEKSLR